MVDILLVEDNPHEVELALITFARHHPKRRIDVVHDGQEAVEYLFCDGRYTARDSTPPAFVLLDLQLPRMNGLEVLERIKGDARTRAVPVVMLTTSREPRDMQESYRLGANSYIIKPVDYREFSEAVKVMGRYWLEYNVVKSY